jgi:hypothetical protein
MGETLELEDLVGEGSAPIVVETQREEGRELADRYVN